MTLKEAMSTSKKYKRPHFKLYHKYTDSDMISLENALADDWELEKSEQIIEVWVNVYSNVLSAQHFITKERADEDYKHEQKHKPYPKRIACVKLTGTYKG